MTLRSKTRVISIIVAVVLLGVLQGMLRIGYARGPGESLLVGSIAAAGCLLCCLLIVPLIERMVEARLTGIRESIRRISDEDVAGKRLPVSGDDEFAALACAVNAVLDRLDAVGNELKTDESRYQSLLNNLPIGFCRVSAEPEFHFVGLNTALVDMLGAASPENVMHVRPIDLFARKRDAVRLWVRLRRQGKVRQVELPLMRTDGSVVWARVSARMVPSHQTASHEIEAFVENITNQKEAEAALEHAERASRAKSESLANISHEIRTPLTSILGYAELLMDADQSPRERLNCLHTIRRNGEHLLSILNDILDLSKIEAGRMLLDVIECSPQQIVSEVGLLLGRRVTDKGLSFETSYRGPIPKTMRTDPTRLRQVLINLVGNAIKFTRSGTVRIEVAMATAPDAPDPRLSFSVIDTGIGMSSEQLQRLFQPFVQAEVSTTRHYGGTGLGLTISKQLVEALGGEIAVRSTLGKGSTFTVTVPTGPLDGIDMLEIDAPPAESENVSGEPPVPEALRLSGRVLLAEDSRDSQHLVAGLLTKVGLSVTACDNGKVACDRALEALAAGEPFDIILMDMHMPVMNGYEATAYLRQKGYTGAIIALTASAMKSDWEECIRVGCNDFLSKPIERSRLNRILARYTASGPAGLDASDTSSGNH